MKKKPTMRDVATEASVALSTVSQVFNNKKSVSAETRQHVLETAKKLGYSKAGYPTAKSGLATIGLLTRSDPDGTSMLTNIFYASIIVSIEQECQRNNLNLMYASINVDDNGRNHNLPPMLLDEMVDGVIVVGAVLEETICDIYHRARRNVVLIDGYTHSEAAFESVLIDNIQGAILAVSHLIEHGHRKIGLIGSNQNDYPSIAERREGYLRTLAQHNIRETFIEESNLNPAVAYEATLRLMQRHPDITAVFACNDITAVSSVMVALRQLGYRVPEDVSVVGFDNTSVAWESSPPLTTVRVDRELMGIMGVQRLIERAANPDRSSVKTVVSTRLIKRDSVRLPADQPVMQAGGSSEHHTTVARSKGA